MKGWLSALLETNAKREWGVIVARNLRGRSLALLLQVSANAVFQWTVKFAVFLMFGASAVIADESAAVKDAIRRHSETVAQVRSYHLKIETHTSHLQLEPNSSCLRFGPYLIGSGEADGRLVHESTVEIWQTGARRRWIDRRFFTSGQQGVLDYGERGLVYEYSVDGSVFRFLSGWDSENPPFQVRLEFSRSAGEFDSVNCAIAATDPIVLEDKASADRATMYWDLLPGWSLARLAEVCELVEVPQSNSSVTRLQILSIPSPDIFDAAAAYVGAVVDLDHDHGWLISRFEGPPGPSSAVREASQFHQTESGFWYASEWQTVHMGRRIDVLSIPICEINQEFTDDVLQVQFPEGARVNDIGGRIHVWGKGKPEESFSNFEDYMNYQKARAIEFQRGGSQQLPLAKGRSGTQWLIIVNVVLVVLLGLFTFLRRRMSRGA